MKVIDEIRLRSNRTDYRIKERICTATWDPQSQHPVFELEQTRNWFDRDSFMPEVGFTLVTPDDEIYEITGVSFLEKRPKKAVFTTVHVPAFDYYRAKKSLA